MNRHAVSRHAISVIAAVFALAFLVTHPPLKVETTTSSSVSEEQKPFEIKVMPVALESATPAAIHYQIDGTDVYEFTTTKGWPCVMATGNSYGHTPSLVCH